VALPPGASAAEVAAHDQQTAELSRYKPGVHASDDTDGYRRHARPAATGKIRCPLKPASLTPAAQTPKQPGNPAPAREQPETRSTQRDGENVTGICEHEAW
jgi:hypothetical protein